MSLNYERILYMKKKIALMLILFMIGTWCVFAEDDEGLAPGWIILIAAGSVLLIGGTIAIVLAASGDHAGAQRVMDSLSVERSEEDIPTVAKTIMENPIVKHTTLGFDKDKVFVGVRFAW